MHRGCLGIRRVSLCVARRGRANSCESSIHVYSLLQRSSTHSHIHAATAAAQCFFEGLRAVVARKSKLGPRAALALFISVVLFLRAIFPRALLPLPATSYGSLWSLSIRASWPGGFKTNVKPPRNLRMEIPLARRRVPPSYALLATPQDLPHGVCSSVCCRSCISRRCSASAGNSSARLPQN